ncbi:MAG TPA: hypothetical protein VIG44_06570, partial [Thermomicrobiales bacterium]
MSTTQFAVLAPATEAQSAVWQTNEFDRDKEFGGPPPDMPRAGGPRRRMPPARRLVIGGVAAAALVVGVLVCVAFSASLNGKLYDNVYVNEQNIGGLTPDAARAALSVRLDPYLNGPV